MAGLSRIEYQTLRICCPLCQAHRDTCDVCDGTGYVCPTCTGARWLAKHREQDASLRVRCRACGLEMSDGWTYDPERELMGVMVWLDEWARGMHPSKPKAPIVNPVSGWGQNIPAPAPEEDAMIRARLVERGE